MVAQQAVKSVCGAFVVTHSLSVLGHGCMMVRERIFGKEFKARCKLGCIKSVGEMFFLLSMPQGSLTPRRRRR